MANNLMMNVRPEFDMYNFVDRLVNTYQAKGYRVNVADFGGNYTITFEKNNEGLNKFLGLGEYLRANVTLMGDVLQVNFTDEDWTSKVIAMVVGWFLCLVPFITGIIGCTRQSALSQSISNDARNLAYFA